MKGLLLITNAVAVLLSLLALILLIRGVVILITGKSKLRGHVLTGQSARIVGIVFVVAPAAAFLLWGLLYESFGWGSSGSNIREYAIRNITSSIVESVLLILGVVGAYIWALSRAKAQRQSENVQQSVSPPSPS